MISMGSKSRTQRTQESRRVVRIILPLLVMSLMAALSLPLTVVLGQEADPPDPNEIRIISEKVDSKFPDNVILTSLRPAPIP